MNIILEFVSHGLHQIQRTFFPDYDCMDSAYDQPEIIDSSRQLGHVSLIDVNPRCNRERKNNIK